MSIISKVKEDSYFQVYGWMSRDLHLRGNNLMIYAIIYSFSKDGKQFSGSLQYLADWTNSTRQGVLKNLKALCAQGLLKKLNGSDQRFCEYMAVEPKRCETKDNRDVEPSSPACETKDNRTVQPSLPACETKDNRTVQPSSPACETKDNEGVEQSLHNTISNNKNNNISDIIEDSSGTLALEKPTIEQVRTYCALRNNGIDPERFWNYYESLGWMIAGSPMRNWTAVIRNWEKREQSKPKPKPRIQERGFGGYTDEDFEEMQRFISGGR